MTQMNSGPEDDPRSDGGTPSMPSIYETVVRAVADAADCDPITLTPLYDVIEPEVLDTLYEQKGVDSHVTFEYAGYEVEILPSQVVLVDSLSY